MITQELKDRWISAARDPKTIQVRGTLVDRIPGTGGMLGYCIMGLLGKVLVDDKIASRELPPREMMGTLQYEHEIHMAVKNFSLDTAGMMVPQLVTLNDHGGRTLGELADWIELHVPAYTPPRPSYPENPVQDLMELVEANVARMFVVNGAGEVLVT
jgi:hypothetical protein